MARGTGRGLQITVDGVKLQRLIFVLLIPVCRGRPRTSTASRSWLSGLPNGQIPSHADAKKKIISRNPFVEPMLEATYYSQQGIRSHLTDQ